MWRALAGTWLQDRGPELRRGVETRTYVVRPCTNEGLGLWEEPVSSAVCGALRAQLAWADGLDFWRCRLCPPALSPHFIKTRLFIIACKYSHFCDIWQYWIYKHLYCVNVKNWKGLSPNFYCVFNICVKFLKNTLDNETHRNPRKIKCRKCFKLNCDGTPDTVVIGAFKTDIEVSCTLWCESKILCMSEMDLNSQGFYHGH